MKKAKGSNASYDIFISYRRDNGWDSAKHLRDILTAKGYRVFFDVDSLRSGNFNTALLDVIKNCTDFIIILSPNSLDRCVNEGDWVRQELACALQAGKNVIPVTSAKFHFPEKLPEDINDVRWKNTVSVNIEYFDATLDKLVSFLHCRPIRKSPLRWLIPVVAVCLAAAVPAFLIFGRNTAGTPSPSVNGEAQEALASDTAVSDYLSTAPMEVGGSITLGSYEQDNDRSNGAEPIDWRILAIEDDRILVISEYGLDAKHYHESVKSVTWESCSLRKWLNEEFLETAFTPEEQNVILTVTTENENNPGSETEGGNSTRDRVFLLSLSEADRYFGSNESRQCRPTAYAETRELYVSSLAPFAGNCSWWLRSPGKTQIYAAYVSSTGAAESDGAMAGSSNDAVRPALWISLSA